MSYKYFTAEAQFAYGKERHNSGKRQLIPHYTASGGSMMTFLEQFIKLVTNRINYT